MLRIKDDKIDKLKDFGFKPKYDEDTGKIVRYVYKYENFKNESKILIEIVKEDMMMGQYQGIEYWRIYLKEFEGLNKIYELFLADMVERI